MKKGLLYYSIVTTIIFSLKIDSLLAYDYMSNPQITQSIKGVILDKESRIKLEGAIIYIPGINRYTSSSINGNFELNNIPIGRHNIEIQYFGYKKQYINSILLTSGKELYLEILMEEDVFTLNILTVTPDLEKSRSQNNMAFVSSRTFSVEEARRFAGAIDDPARMAANYAGVVPASATNNAIIIRGNAPKGILWRLEGIDIPRPNHFSESNVAGGGGITIFSGQMLSNSDFFTGAFPSEYSNAFSGVFDLKFRNGNPSKKEHSFQIGVQGIEFSSEGPIIANNGSSYLFNYRYSTMGLVFQLLPETKESNELPIYQDLSFKINYPIKKGTISVWGIGGLSKSTIKGSNDPDKWIYTHNKKIMKFNYDMGATGLMLKKSISPKSFIESGVGTSYSGHLYSEKLRFNDIDSIRILPIHNISNIQRSISIFSSYQNKITPNSTIRLGLSSKILSFNLNGDAIDYRYLSYQNFMKGSGNAILNNIFIQNKRTISNQVEISAGLSLSNFSLNNETLIEPRASIKYNFSNSSSLSFGFGRHSQTEMLFIYYIQKESDDGTLSHPNKKLKLSKSNHFILSYDKLINRYTRIKIEPYYQFLYDIPVEESSSYSTINFKDEWTLNKALVNKGTGENIGIDITLERFLNLGIYYLSTISIYNSSYQGVDHVKKRTRYNGKYAVNFLFGKEINIKNKNLLGINLKFSIKGPEWRQEVDNHLSNQFEDIIYNTESAFNYRNSSIEYATDATITYRINHTKSSSMLAFQIKNIIGKEYMGKKYNIKEQTIENDYFKSILPFISYKLEF